MTASDIVRLASGRTGLDLALPERRRRLGPVARGRHARPIRGDSSCPPAASTRRRPRSTRRCRCGQHLRRNPAFSLSEGAAGRAAWPPCGYPLDQNLYQCVKGLRAAAGIVRQGGLIILAAACEDGLPAHDSCADLLATSSGPAEFLRRLSDGEIRKRDQWQVQVHAQVQLKARVLAFTPGVSAAQLRRAWLEPTDDIGTALREALTLAGPGARTAILPDGPQTIAYVA
jgi:hypothetical protein